MRSGKVRDLYSWKEELWLVASDRLSAFDVILPTPIPDKGVILTQLSRFWFELTRAICRNHAISFDVPSGLDLPEWHGRLTRCRRLKIVPVECVARGYLAGSGWKDYQATGTVQGIRLPPGLVESEKLPEPIFTPTTKAEAGHDLPLTPEQARRQLGDRLFERLSEATLEVYDFAYRYSRDRGIILADTKLEFGLDGDEVVLADELLTPDSSRFWPADSYVKGRGQPSFDKQFVRDYLESLDWDKRPPGPALPPAIVKKTLARYREALDRLTACAL